MVGIVTWYNHSNLGGNLQAYALRTFVASLGYESLFINYCGTRNVHVVAIRRAVRPLAAIVAKSHRKTPFMRFQEQYLPETRLYSKDQLKTTNGLFNAFICGSDQIWAPNVFDSAYFLDFVSHENKKIAYAPSVGMSAIPANLVGSYKRLIEDIDFVSVRERSSAELLRKFVNKEIHVVLDPCFLLDKNSWSDLCKTTKNTYKDYILCYVLGDIEKMLADVDRFARERSKRVICLGNIFRTHKVVPEKSNWLFLRDVGPIEFVSLIMHSDMVITDSYHGIVLSIILQKDFYAFKRFDDTDAVSQNNRIYDLLRLTHLDKRLIDHRVMEMNGIDYRDVGRIVSEYKEYSKAFLANSLGK